LYDAIDQSTFFVGTAAKEDRSLMNVCFVMAEEHKEKEAAFLEFAKECGMVGIKGHRLVDGFRASIYNACPREAVEALVQCMRDFEDGNC
jgi:phosphoserine aminotransferase